MAENERIKLNNVRLSWPSLYETEKFKGEDTDKYAATFIIPKDDPAAKKIKKRIDELLKENKVKKMKDDKICLKDGDESEYEEYEDHYHIKCTNSKRPTLLDKDKTPVTKEDDIFYPGCRVNASIDLWFQDNDWGKRINANLYGVQFNKDDEPFGMGPIDATDDFDEVDDDDDI